MVIELCDVDHVTHTNINAVATNRAVIKARTATVPDDGDVNSNSTTTSDLVAPNNTNGIKSVAMCEHA